jgi:hypothetical protein
MVLFILTLYVRWRIQFKYLFLTQVFAFLLPNYIHNYFIFYVKIYNSIAKVFLLPYNLVGFEPGSSPLQAEAMNTTVIQGS